MDQLLGASWLCLLVAGLWSLACGYFLRRAWTAQADGDSAAQLALARNEATRLRTDVQAKNAALQTLEADLAGGQRRLVDLEASKLAELEPLRLQLASHEAKAAGFDLARVTALKSLEQRDESIAGLNQQLQTAQSALAETRARADAGDGASAKAAAELAQSHKAWDVERAGLLSEHGTKLAALDQSHGEVRKSHGSEIASLVAKVAGLAMFESKTKDLSASLEASQHSLRSKDDALATLEKRLRVLDPLPAKLASTDAELLATRRSLAERDTALSAITADKARLSDQVKQRDAELATLQARVAELAPWHGKFKAADTELLQLRSRVTELEPWKLKFTQADAELGRLRLRVAELEPWQGKFKAADTELGQLRPRIAELEPWKAKFTLADEELGRLRTRVTSLEPWQARFTQAEAELNKLRPRIAELEPLEMRFKAADTERTQLRERISELEPWKLKFNQAEEELGRLRARVTALEPWQTRFTQAEGELASLRPRIAELEPWQGKYSKAEEEVVRLRNRILELQPLQDQLRVANQNHVVEVKRRDDDITRLSAESRSRVESLEDELAGWRRRYETAERLVAGKDGQIEALARRVEELRNAPAKVIEKIVEVDRVVSVAAPTPAPARLSAATPGTPDDLKIIEGIGPKIEQLLNAAGYLTFGSVAVADPKALARILEAAGPRFTLARPESWPEQAGLLANNDMEAFNKLTDALKGGVRR